MVTGLFKKLLANRKAADRRRRSKVLVAGEFVRMTAPQARRYEELRRAKAAR